MIYLLCIPFILAYLMLIWFETNAFIEYSFLIKLDKIFPLFKKYRIMEEAGSPLNFKEYLGQFYSRNFIVRLITCPICLATWLSIIASLILIILGYKYAVILLFPIAYISLFLYEFIKKIMKS